MKNKVTAMGLLAPLAKAIEVFVSDEKPASEYERPLRLFQFRYWLIDDAVTRVSFQDAALLFSSIAMGQEASKIRSRFSTASGFELMLLAISRPRLRWLINETFGRTYTIYDLTQIPLFPYDENKAERIKYGNPGSKCFD